MSDYLYLPPHRNVLAGRTVTALVGTPDADHPLSYLTDLRPAFPIRFPAGNWAVSISVATQAVQLVALANTSLDSVVTVTGGVTGSIPEGDELENGARFNPYLMKDDPTAGVTALILSGSNAVPAIVGEAFAGVPLEIPAFGMRDFSMELLDGPDNGILGEFMNIPAYDEAREWRVIRGTQTYTTEQRNVLLSAKRAQRGGSQPGLLIIDRDEQDAMVVLLGRTSFKQMDHPDLWEGSLEFLEYPRYRW